MTEPSNMIAFPQLDAKVWIDSYQRDCLTQKGEATVDAYVRILRQFTAWVAKLPGQGGTLFLPSSRRPQWNGICLPSGSRGIVSVTAPVSKRCSTDFASGSLKRSMP